MADTKQRILDAAEHLFAEHGFADTSLRQIISEAGVNLAAVHYHFHSKESLLEAVLLRRIGPLNEERLKRLDECERSGTSPLSLECVLEAFILPTVLLMQDPAQGGMVFGRLMARLHAEAVAGSTYARIAKKHFTGIAQRFIDALTGALPDVPLADIFWRANFAAGAMSQTLRNHKELEIISGGLCNASDLEGAMRRAIVFMAAGFRASVVIEKAQETHS
ncbi:MAG: acnR [Bryobacterales bacterium]|nr:acnR [Bryobacterales bacterium]